MLAGERWIDPELAQRALRVVDQESSGRSRDPLSPREIEITRLVAGGFRSKEVAERFSITEGSVKTHLRTIFEKLGVESRAGLANWARARGLL